MIVTRLWPILLASIGGAACAAPVELQLRRADGRPAAGAVVMIDSAHPPAGPIRFPWPYAVAQKDISFQPHVLIVPVGASVAFPNRDKVRHHVYSFSKPKKFELKLYGQEEARTVVFDKPGVVALGCNIHDAMNGFVVVVATPYAAQADAAGRVRFDVGVGAATVRVWDLAIRAPGNMISQPLTVAGGGASRIVTLP